MGERAARRPLGNAWLAGVLETVGVLVDPDIVTDGAQAEEAKVDGQVAVGVVAVNPGGWLGTWQEGHRLGSHASRE